MRDNKYFQVYTKIIVYNNQVYFCYTRHTIPYVSTDRYNVLPSVREAIKISPRKIAIRWIGTRRVGRKRWDGRAG